MAAEPIDGPRQFAGDVLLAKPVDLVEDRVRQPVKETTAFTVEPVRIQGNGFRAFQEGQKEKKHQGRKHQQLQLCEHMGERIGLVVHFAKWQNAIERAGINAQENTQERHESHGEQHGAGGFAGPQAAVFGKKDKIPTNLGPWWANRLENAVFLTSFIPFLLILVLVWLA